MTSYFLAAALLAVVYALPQPQSSLDALAGGNLTSFDPTVGDGKMPLGSYPPVPFVIDFLENDNYQMHFRKAGKPYPELSKAGEEMFRQPIKNLGRENPDLPGPTDIELGHEPDQKPYLDCRPAKGDQINWTIRLTILFLRTLERTVHADGFTEFEFDLIDRKRSGKGIFARCKFFRTEVKSLELGITGAISGPMNASGDDTIPTF